MNKGNVRGSADDLKALTGIDIVKEVQAVKDAQALSSWTPRTGDRQLDIMRAVYAPGAFGFAGGGLLGGALTAAATSPKLHGKIALGIGKMRGSKAGKTVGEYVTNTQPGLSTKYISGMTREKLDQLRDYLIDQLPKSSGKLNLEIEDEAGNFVDYLKDTATINAQDVNRAMEILRLQGKTDVIETLRKQLGAAPRTQGRDDLGRFASKKLGEALMRR